MCYKLSTMGARVLVVDDDSGIRQLIAAVLRRQLYEVDEAVNGQEAIANLTDHAYDALFLDLMMPVRNGYEVLAFLRARAVQRKYVVVMTAGGSRETWGLDDALVQRVIRKPFDIVDVLGAASDCVGKPRRARTSPDDI